MTYATRFLSRSTRQVYTGQSIFRSEYVVPTRSFAKAVGSNPPALKGDEILKGVFLEVKKKFETALGILRKEKITIDPDDPAAVAEYSKVMKTVREKADLLSESQRIKYTIETRTQGIPDARSYLLVLKDIRTKRGLVDDMGAETMMMDALDKVEKELKKPLMRNDKKGMALLMAEFDKVNQKLGIRKEDLPKYEEQLELKIAKAQLEELKKDVLEAMETQKKRCSTKEWQSKHPNLNLPQSDVEISNMRKMCLKRYFPNDDIRREVNVELAKFFGCIEEFADEDSLRDRWEMDPIKWWLVHGSPAPHLQSIAMKLLGQVSSSSCCERNWSTYAFIHSTKRNKITPQRAEDLVFVHNNLRLLSRKTQQYMQGESKMWDVAGDAFEHMEDVGVLEVASLSLDEPEMESILFVDEISEEPQE